MSQSTSSPTSTRASTTFKSSTTTRAATATTSLPEFWWSYNEGNDTVTGYDPVFEVCGSSCSDCDPKAKRCHADEFSNICYEPDLGETCCQDVYGTACNKGFYCAYNTEQIAFCCKQDTPLLQCGNLFEEKLSTTSRQVVSTVVVTRIFAASSLRSGTGSAATLAARPGRTAAPKIPGVNYVNGTATDEGGPSLGAKIGISLGSFAALVMIAGALLFFFLKKRRQSAYKQIHVPLKEQHNPYDQAPHGQHQNSPFLGHASPHPPSYEPMRGAEQPVGFYAAKHAHESTAPPPGVAHLPYHDNPSEYVPPPLKPQTYNQTYIVPPHGIAELPYSDAPASSAAASISTSHNQHTGPTPPPNIAELPHNSVSPGLAPHPLRSNPHSGPADLPELSVAK